MLSWVRESVRDGSLVVDAERDFEVGSRWTGRRVNVSSMVAI